MFENNLSKSGVFIYRIEFNLSDKLLTSRIHLLNRCMQHNLIVRKSSFLFRSPKRLFVEMTEPDEMVFFS